jgi:hypothetical protein
MRKLVTSMVTSSSLSFPSLLVLTVLLAAAGLSVLIANDAVAQGTGLYQLHRDGRIWRSTGVPCTGESCPGWQMLDNNPATIAIATSGGEFVSR